MPDASELPGTLVHLAQRLMALAEEIAAGGGITPQQWAVLHQVGEAGASGRTPSEIAAASGTTRANVTKLVRGLVRPGLVQIRASPADGRRRPLALTPAGSRLLARLDGEKARRIADALAGLAAAERASLHRLGRKLLARLGTGRLA